MSWDNYEMQLAAIYDKYPLTPWPFMEIMYLRGCSRTQKNHGHAPITSVDIFQRIEEDYGVRVNTLKDAIQYLDQQVEVERRKVLDRAAKYRKRRADGT